MNTRENEHAPVTAEELAEVDRLAAVRDNPESVGFDITTATKGLAALGPILLPRLAAHARRLEADIVATVTTDLRRAWTRDARGVEAAPVTAEARTTIETMAGKLEAALMESAALAEDRDALVRAILAYREAALGHKASAAAMAADAMFRLVAGRNPMPDALRRTIAEIAERLRTQDNRATHAPIFIVEEKRRTYGFDPKYSDNVVWLNGSNNNAEASPEEHARLEAEREKSGDKPEDWTRTAYQDTWEFVTACLTEQGCADYIARNGHNHRGELRIYAASSYRNDEFQAVRDYLMRHPRSTT